MTRVCSAAAPSRYNPPVRCLPLLAALLALAACERPTHPWDQPEAGVAPTVMVPPTPIVAPVTASPSAGSPPPADDAGAAELPDTPTPLPVRVGGPWVRCYGGFHPAGDPVQDVTRLSLLCGPENGMKRLSKQPIEGELREGGPAVTQGFDARRGECYRVFAVAASAVADLDVVVRSSRGAAVAADHVEDRWPVVQPDRPFCPLEDDRYSVEISAKKGSGRFAAEVWALKTPGAKRP